MIVSSLPSRPLASWLTSLTLTLAAIMSATPLAAQESPVPITFNTPYRCADGTVMIVTKCEVKGRFEFCSFRNEKNGQLINEAYSVRSQMAGRVKACPLQADTRPIQAAAKTTASTSASASANGQLNPPYLREMPPVDRVLQAMKTNDPRETALRQIGAFYELSEIIKTLSGHREFRGFTPDESRILQDYATAQYKVGLAADAAFPGPYKTEKKISDYMPYRYSRNDPRFGVEGIPVFQAFFSRPLQAQFEQIIGAENARYAAMRAEQIATAKRALQANSQAAAAQDQSQFARNDPGTLAARRCVESGRNELECVGEGFKVGLTDLMGPAVGGALGNALPGGSASSGPAGLRLSGIFRAEKLSISFSDGGAVMQCGTLVPQGFDYVVQRTANQILVKVDVSPKPLVMALRQDGKLSGPGPIDIAGRVVVGYSGGGTTSGGGEMQTTTTTQSRQISANDVPNYNVGTVHQNGMEYSVNEQVTSTSWVPSAPQVQAPVAITKPKTEQCNAGMMSGTPSVGVMGALTEVMDPSQKAVGKPMGLRLNGTYAGQGGLSIEFRSDLATVECGPAHVAMAYAVEHAGGQVAVKIQNPTGPFTLALQPDGKLAGSGTIDVAGRVVTGSRGNEILYAPKNARCTVGSLAPKS